MRKNKRIRENISILKKVTSEEKYLYFLKHYDKKDTLKTHILQITVYDKLDNHGMNLLMKQIHMLKKNKKYSVNAYYKKPGKKELDYVHGNLEGYSTFSIAEIKFNGDKWMSSIDVAGTNITNSEILIEYTFHLKRSIVSYRMMHDFVSEHKIHFSKYDFPFLYLRMSDLNYTNYLDQEEHSFYDCFQDILCEFFYSELGEKYPLPMEVCARLMNYNRKKARKLQNVFLATVYKQNNEYLIIKSYGDRFYAINYFYGSKFSGRRLFRYFAEYSVEMYYKAFQSIEISELEQVMRKYLNSRKKSVSANDMKWMINRLRGVEEKEERLKNELEYRNEAAKWKRFDKDKWIDEGLITDNTVSAHFKDLYRKNLDYLQAISTTRDNKIIYFITIISLVVALIGLFISLWAVIKPESPNVINKNYNMYQYNDNRKTNENKYSIFD